MPKNLLLVARKYTLFLAMLAGSLIFCIFHYTQGLDPYKMAIKGLALQILPYMIFIMLFLSFCRIEIKKMRLRWWHLELLIIQVGLTAVAALYLKLHPSSDYFIAIEGFIACISTPTAASAAAIVEKLGGNVSGMTIFTLLSNLAAAISIPLLYPLFLTHLEGDFMTQFGFLMQRVFPVIVLPLILAMLVKYLCKPLHRLCVTKLRGISFYIWSFNLTILCGLTIANLVNSQQEVSQLLVLAAVGLAVTVVGFSLGKLCGNFEGQRITAGQGLGQRNMVFSIWLALTYLAPAASIAPGCFLIFQNLVNATQLWNYERRTALGLKNYQDQF